MTVLATNDDPTLELQFRLPSGHESAGGHKADVQIELEEAGGHAMVDLSERWRGHDGERAAILATASLCTRRTSASSALPDRVD
jgi:hypothetical protein